jgi:hypothetical protein
MISNNLINMNGNYISLYDNGQDCSMAALLLNGQAAAPVSLVANMPTTCCGGGSWIRSGGSISINSSKSLYSLIGDFGKFQNICK